MGSAAEEVLDAAPEQSTLSIVDVAAAFDQLALASGPAQKSPLLRDLLRRATPLEAKYIIKIIGGDLRIGLHVSLVGEASAKSFDSTAAQGHRANLLLVAIAMTLRRGPAAPASRTPS